MFTGIVEEVGRVRWLSNNGDAVSLAVDAVSVVEDLKPGDSVAVDGACLTITEVDTAGFTVGLSPETLRRTAFRELRPGARVNLERAVRVGDRLGGHIVQGHVDGVATITALRPEGDSVVVTFELPPDLGRYVVHKGFVAVDGASLTVMERTDDQFSVALIAYTQEHVGLLDKGLGGRVNLEVDIIAKYVESLIRDRDP